MDFFTVPTLTGRVLFVLVVLSHQRRRVVHVNITEHPTALWSAQQVVDAFPGDTAPRWLHRNRDCIYGDVFQRRMAGMGIADVVSAPASPWQNPYVERPVAIVATADSEAWAMGEPLLFTLCSQACAGAEDRLRARAGRMFIVDTRSQRPVPPPQP